MTFPVVIGLTGYAQHGKDTVGNRLVERWDFERFAFADPLKSMALTLDPIISFHEELCDEVVPTRLAAIVDEHGWEVAKKSPEVRRFLQVLGTEAVRGHLGDDTWVRTTGRAILESDVDRAVITDARFPNEFKYIQREMGGKLIRVTRLNADGTPFDNGLGENHPSEMHVASAPADFNIVSVSGDMADLLAKADAVAADILEGF